MCRKAFFVFFSVFFCNGLWSQITDTVEVYFDINEYEIYSANAKHLKKIADIKIITDIRIFAYTDFLGDIQYNKILSQKRADAVSDFLISNGTDAQIITKREGKGVHPSSSYENRRNENDPGILLHRKAIIIFTYPNDEKNEETVEYAEVTEFQEKQEVIPIFREISIDSIEVGEHLILDNIIFYGGTHRIHRNSYRALHSLLGFMRANPTVSISIEGHICCEYGGRDGYDIDAGNHFLSENRARVVYDFLANNGIDEKRLQYKGHGSKHKLYPDEKNTYEQDMNRRVEIVILDK